MKNFSIRKKLVLLIAIVLIPLIVLYIVRAESFYKYNTERELESNRRLVEAISSSFMNYVGEVLTQETTLNTIFAKKPALTRNEMQYYLKEALKNQSIIAAFAWINPKGIVIGCTREDLLGKSVKDREYFRQIMNGKDEVISDVVIGYSTKMPVIPIAKAAREGGNLIGFMVAIIDIDKLGQRLPSPSLISDYRFGIVDKNGNKIYQSDIAHINQIDMKMSESSPVWLALKGKVVMTPSRKSGYDNTIRMGVYVPISGIGWASFVTTPYKSVMGKYDQQLRNDMIIMLLVILISILIAFYLSHLYLKRLNKLKEAANMMVDGNYTARACLTGTDEISITAQAFDRMAEGIENYDKLKTQFFTNLSHELKTPVNVIFSSVQLVEQKRLQVSGDKWLASFDRHMKIVRQNCYRLIRLVNNLIDISRYDCGFYNVKPNIINIVEIIENITLSIVKYAESKEIEILFDTEIEEKYILCDPDIIERIMLNLFSNSLKFTNQKGAIYVNIFDKDESVVITFKDTGIGIPKDKLDIIFERFRQVDNTLNRNHEGSGIGLSLVKALVETHKGKISVVSKIGEGTEFTIQLPVGIFPDQNYSKSFEEGEAQRTIDRINIEFSDIYSFKDLE